MRELVHENFGDFALNKTAEDVVALYNSARVFVDWFLPQLGNTPLLSMTADRLATPRMKRGGADGLRHSPVGGRCLPWQRAGRGDQPEWTR